MKNLLAYNQHYWKDVKLPANVLSGWGTKSASFHKQVNAGDVIWVVITGGPNFPSEWRLLQRITVASLYIDAANTYKYRVREDRQRSQIYDPDLQVNLEPLLKQLEFASGTHITSSGRLIGQTLQNIRPLIEADGQKLQAYAATLAPVLRTAT